MVRKPCPFCGGKANMFENDVKMYGTQALLLVLCSLGLFENDVKMYGTQALSESSLSVVQFENDVKMYGTQACFCSI